MRISKRLRKVLPSKRVCEEFNLTYELKGAQRAVSLLSKYYRIGRMKIVVDGNSDEALYDYGTYTAYFKKRTIGKRLVLHEFYHHIVYVRNWDMSERREEREAERYSSDLSKSVSHRSILGNGYSHPWHQTLHSNSPVLC